MRGIVNEPEWQDIHQRFEENKEISNGYLKLFRNEVEIRLMEDFLGLSERSSDCAGEVKESVIA